MIASVTGWDTVRVGVIGYGRFGRFVVQILKSKFKNTHVLVSSRRREKLGIDRGVEFASLDDVCSSDVVIPCVSISAFEEVIKAICGKIKPGSLLVDVCSVKIYPVEVMTRYIPDNVEILATHPAFGPDSAKRGLRDLKIILHNVRIPPSKFARIVQSCQDIGLKVIEMSPEKHDELMAFSLAYAHLVGRIGERMSLSGRTSFGDAAA